MENYAVQTCEYCLEVQVEPKGHRIRNCQAFKPKMHAWQEATIDDIVPPVYVWLVKDLKREEPLENRLKRYYGRLHAVVELFAHAGTRVSEDYASFMRKDTVMPELDEVNLFV